MCLLVESGGNVRCIETEYRVSSTEDYTRTCGIVEHKMLENKMCYNKRAMAIKTAAKTSTGSSSLCVHRKKMMSLLYQTQMFRSSVSPHCPCVYCCVSIVLVIVVYLSTVEATILVTPMQKPFTSDLIVQTAVNPVNPTDVKGAVVTGTLHKTKTFIPTGTGAKKIEGFAKGNLTITNKTSISQSLVATTRFLSKEGVLFRLEKSVIVPANGSVVASVYADKIGASGNIPASHFTIPGLSPVKQASIYADSTVAFTGGEQAIAVVKRIGYAKNALKIVQVICCRAIWLRLTVSLRQNYRPKESINRNRIWSFGDMTVSVGYFMKRTYKTDGKACI